VSAGLKGNIGTLRNLQRNMENLPRVLAGKVCLAAVNVITQRAQSTFAAGQNAYGDPWVSGYDGRAVTLRKSGALASGVKYVSFGTRMRSVLGAAHAKYQVGRRPVLPTGALPPSYDATLQDAVGRVAAAELARGT
jgi:hypothetical protein